MSKKRKEKVEREQKQNEKNNENVKKHLQDRKIFQLNKTLAATIFFNGFHIQGTWNLRQI